MLSAKAVPHELISIHPTLPLQMQDLELQLRRSQLDRGNSVAESVVGRDWRTQEMALLKQEVSAHLWCHCGVPTAGQGSACWGFLHNQQQALLKPPLRRDKSAQHIMLLDLAASGGTESTALLGGGVQIRKTLRWSMPRSLTVVPRQRVAS